jgi:hypothetical protein
VNDNLIVTFADLLGPVKGGGAVDVFNTDGVFQYQIDQNGPTSNVAADATGRLENPWGVTLAPAKFGMYSNDLLVGNVWGPGHINVYKPDSNGNYTIYAGQLAQPDGTPIAIKGLWDLEFDDGPHLFFDAGPNHPGDATGGLFGMIHAAGDQDGNGGGDAGRAAAAPLAQQQKVLVSVPALPASYLGEEPGNQVWISPNAAGWGSKFSVPMPTGQTDLGSVPDRELGHVLGVEDGDNLQDVMGETLAAGTQSVALALSADGPWTW